MVAVGSRWVVRALISFLVFSCSSISESEVVTDLHGADFATVDLLERPDGPTTIDILEVELAAGRIGDGQAGPQPSGCVLCHTDKDRLYALAPPLPPVEEESGGG